MANKLSYTLFLCVALCLSETSCDRAICPEPVIPSIPYVNQSVELDGIDDRLTVQYASDLNLGTGPFTIETFFKSNLLTSNGQNQVILSNRTSYYNGFMYGLWEDGHLWVQLEGVPNIGYNKGPVLFDGKCHHVTVTRDASYVVSFFVDDSLTYQTFSDTYISSLGNWMIGYDHLDSTDTIEKGDPFEGFIDEIRVWNTTLSANELSANSNQRLNGNEAGLIANWTFSEGSGQTASDINNKHSTFMGNNTTVESTDPLWTLSPCSVYK